MYILHTHTHKVLIVTGRDLSGYGWIEVCVQLNPLNTINEVNMSEKSWDVNDDQVSLVDGKGRLNDESHLVGNHDIFIPHAAS